MATGWGDLDAVEDSGVFGDGSEEMNYGAGEAGLPIGVADKVEVVYLGGVVAGWMEQDVADGIKFPGAAGGVRFVIEYVGCGNLNTDEVGAVEEIVLTVEGAGFGSGCGCAFTAKFFDVIPGVAAGRLTELGENAEWGWLLLRWCGAGAKEEQGEECCGDGPKLGERHRSHDSGAFALCGCTVEVLSRNDLFPATRRL